MSIIDDLPPKSETMSRVWRGIIASNPSNITQRVTVKLPDASDSLVWKHCRWAPRYEIEQISVSEGADTGGDTEPSHSVSIPQLLLPKRGDLCLCIFDNYKELWVVMWWPY